MKSNHLACEMTPARSRESSHGVKVRTDFYNNIILNNNLLLLYRMARNRKSFKTKPKKTFYQKVKSGVSLASKVASTAATVASLVSMVNAEKQYFDYQYTFATTGQPMYLISGIPQGDDEGARTGNSIKLNSIYLQMAIGMSASATQTFVRFMVVEDKFQTGTAPTAADLIQYTYAGASVNNVINTICPLNVDHTTRYRVLLDKRLSLSINGRMNAIYRKYFKFDKHVHYTGSGATDTYSSNIYLVIFHNEPTNYPTINIWGRIGYYDN